MFLTGKKVALAGIALALSFILLQLGSIIEVSTLFFLVAGAFCIGIVIRETGKKMGAAFLAASLLLGIFLSPNPFYVATYGVIQVYILLREWLWDWLEQRGKKAGVMPDRRSYWIGKAVIFQGLVGLLYGMAHLILKEILLPEMLISTNVVIRLLVFEVAAVLLWLLIDYAYDIFQLKIWGRIRHVMQGR